MEFMPHGHCYFWLPEILWPMVITNLLIFCAYFTISTATFYLIYNIRHEWHLWRLALLFCAFIFFCGFDHLWSVLVIYDGSWYPLIVWWKILTTVFSVASAILLLIFREDIRFLVLLVLTRSKLLLERAE